MSEPTTPSWLVWVVPVITVMGAVGVIAKKLFTNAVREQMMEMHEENRKRLLVVEKTLSRIEGRMKERWGEYTEHDQ